MCEEIDWNKVFSLALRMKESDNPVDQMYAKATLRAIDEISRPSVFERLAQDTVVRRYGCVKVSRHGNS